MAVVSQRAAAAEPREPTSSVCISVRYLTQLLLLVRQTFVR